MQFVLDLLGIRWPLATIKRYSPLVACSAALSLGSSCGPSSTAGIAGTCEADACEVLRFATEKAHQLDAIVAEGAEGLLDDHDEVSQYFGHY